MEILVGFEHNYVMPYGVMFQSLVYNNPNETIHVHAIVNESVTNEDKNDLSKIIKQSSHNRIDFYKFDKGRVKVFPLSSVRHFRESCYYRLYAASILPPEIDKVIYLDGDMVVRHSISDLWEYDIEDASVAGVTNQTEKVEFYNRLHYPMKKKYINNGVAIFNLKKWRKEGTEQKFTDMILKYPERIVNADQDVMNVVLQDDKIILPIKYNVQEFFYYQLKYMTFDYWEYQSEFDLAIKDPIILHYAGPEKPWLIGCLHPLKDEFFKYRSMTVWKDEPLIKSNSSKGLKQMVRSTIVKIATKTGLIKRETKENKFIQISIDN